MRKTCTLLAALGMTLGAWAVPAKRFVTTTVQMSDGTTQVVTLRGDETFHYYTTPDGRAVRENADGTWEMDTRDVKALHAAALARRNAHRQQLAEKTRRHFAPRRAGASTTTGETKRGLLILVNFANLKMKNGSNSKDIFDQMLNAIGNPYGKNYGSVREFFRAQSYGQFDVEFDVVGPVTVSQTMSYYGKDVNGEGGDKAPEEMVMEACRLVDDEVNFADYDWDGDGEVENIYVTYAGYGQASGASSSTIWPHQWTISEATGTYDDKGQFVPGSPLTLDGVHIDTYACGSELAGTSGSTIDGIGTMCHEYSHCLGLPDFYDSANQTNFGMGTWSIMDTGCYNGDGFCPAGYTSYERWFSGWLEPVELSQGTTVSGMKDIEENPEAYIIYNDANHDEYYLLENHQLKGWDKSAYGHGLLVLHVDYDQTAWYENKVNTTKSRQRMTIIPADNEASTGGDYLDVTQLAGDPFPGTKKKTELTDESTPKASLNRVNTDGKKLMHKPITDITEAGGLISFKFMGGEQAPALVDVPVLEDELTENVDYSYSYLTARWGEVENAVSYDLQYSYTQEVEEDPESEGDLWEAMTMFESFEQFYVEDEDADMDGNIDLTATESLDDYTDMPGWTGEKVYQGLFGAKVGSSKKAGKLVSPFVSGETGELTVYVEGCDWFNYQTLYNQGIYKHDGSQLAVVLYGEDGTALETQTVELGKMTDDGEYFIYPSPIVVNFSNVPATYKVGFEPTKRAYLYYLMAFDGAFDAAEIDASLGFLDGEYDDEAYDDWSWAPRRVRHAPKHALSTKTVTNTVSGITDTHYTITDLPEGATVTYKVQAVDEKGGMSGWSSPVSFTLPMATDAVSNVVRTDRQPLSLFDLSGRKVNGSTLRPGIYVSKGRKVLVK